MSTKIIRCATIGLSLNIFCKGVLTDLKDQGYEVVALSSPDEDLHELAEREMVRVIGVPMERHISLIRDLKSLWQLMLVFRQERPDMVHSMTPKAGLLCMIAAWLARVPVRVHTFTGLVWPTAKGLQRKVLMLTDKITCSCATHVIPEGQGVLKDLAEHITKKPMRVLGYGNIRGIDLSYWTKDKALQISNDKCQKPSAGEEVFTFLFVGRIVGDKGINELIEAMRKLISDKSLETSTKCRLVLVGPYEDNLDPVKPETRKMIDEMPEIEAVGPMFGDDLLAWYAATDCFVFPSYREGFPNTVIEAGAMELASIVTDINGSREIVVDGESGIIIPSKDAGALYKAMCWMLEHDDERREMGQMARKIVSERFEQGFVREQLYAFYRSVLSEK